MMKFISFRLRAVFNQQLLEKAKLQALYHWRLQDMYLYVKG